MECSSMEDNKPEWPPLLEPGLFPMTIEEVRAICVDAFPTSERRPLIMKGLLGVIGQLDASKINAEIWLDGSFLTKKIEPDDVDLVLVFNGEILESGTEKMTSLLVSFNDTGIFNQFYCHTFVCPQYPDSDDEFLKEQCEKNLLYWKKLFGFSRGNDEGGNRVNDGVYKGIALVSTPTKTGMSTGRLQ